MNRKIVLFTIAVTAIVLSVILGIYNNSPDVDSGGLKRPAGTMVGEEEENDFALKRKAWIEQMHKTAPGVNWRKLDYKNRLEKHLNKDMKNINSNSVSVAGGALTGEWRETGSNNCAGRMLATEFDEEADSIYGASDGGNIWKADKNGNGWRSLSDDFKFESVRMLRKIDHNGGKRLLSAVAGWYVDGFMYSDDDGENWIPAAGLSGISDWGEVQKAIVCNDSLRTIYLLAFEWDYTNWYQITTVYTSVDHGETFTMHVSYDEPGYGGPEKFDIWTSYYGSEDVYMLENSNVYIFDTASNPVYLSTINPSSTGDVMLTGCEKDGMVYLYAAVYANDNADFYCSSDGGTTWSPKGSVPSNPFIRSSSLSCSSKNPNVLYFGGVEAYRSYNGADTWTKLNDWYDYYGAETNMLHADIPGFNSFLDQSGNEFVYINTDGGTYISEDSLESVQNISLINLNVSQYYSSYTCKFDPNYIYAGAQDQGYQFTNADDGFSTLGFDQIVSGDYGHLVSGDMGASLWMVYPGYTVYYPDAINAPYASDWWEFLCSGNVWMPPLMPDPNDPAKVYMGGGSISSGAHLFHFTGTGTGLINYEEESFDFGGVNDATIASLACSPINPDYRYVINSEGTFYMSDDGGTSWTQTSGFDGPDGNYLYGSCILPSPNQLGRVYVAGSGYSNSPVYVSQNHGQSFITISSGLPETMVYELAVTENEEFVFAATELGPYVLIPGNYQWYDLAQGIAPNQVYWSVDYIPVSNTVRFATYGRGIWDLKLDNFVSIGEEYNKKPDPMNISVYPNPATDYISLSITGESANKALVSIVSITGKCLLTRQVQSEAETKIDLAGLAPGIYYLSVESKGSQIATKKFIVQ